MGDTDQGATEALVVRGLALAPAATTILWNVHVWRDEQRDMWGNAWCPEFRSGDVEIEEIETWLRDAEVANANLTAHGWATMAARALREVEAMVEIRGAEDVRAGGELDIEAVHGVLALVDPWTVAVRWLEVRRGGEALRLGAEVRTTLGRTGRLRGVRDLTTAVVRFPGDEHDVDVTALDLDVAIEVGEEGQ